MILMLLTTLMPWRSQANTQASKPLPQYHIKISGFDDKVSRMSSLRQPHRITIRGDDERDHMYLVKGGEDLRQDQRIQQLFTLSNLVLREDPMCRGRGLALVTYQVIPLTHRIGLIEWLENTKPLKAFLYSDLTKSEQTSLTNAQNMYCKFVREGVRKEEDSQDMRKIYQNHYKRHSRRETMKRFHAVESLVPWDMLRRGFLSMSRSSESFLVVRSHFARSHAVLSTCQYILGIGDRHLDNFMLDLHTGAMVGIDFGHAFGSATQFLGVPELMPFRLSRQLLGVLLPHGAGGLLQQTMAHCLRAVRDRHNLLLTTMDVFINEPSVDWQSNARKQERYQGRTEDHDPQWYPKEKVKFAKLKLEGANPAYITSCEVKLGALHKPALNQFLEVIQGCKGENCRANLADLNLTVEQQVESLIDQATDANILGRTYEGWSPWI